MSALVLPLAGSRRSGVQIPGLNALNGTAAGMGSQMLLYHVATGCCIMKRIVLPCGIHVHGIDSVQIQGGSLLAVHGERIVKVGIVCVILNMTLTM